jgi:hypothetical protein
MELDERPWLTVWELSEFVFCPRAGQIARRSKLNDGVDGERRLQEDDQSYGELDYFPHYDAMPTEEALTQVARQINQVVIAVAVLIAVSYAIHRFIWPGALWVGIIAVLPWPFRLMQLFAERDGLLATAKPYRERLPNEPRTDLAGPEEYHWWDFHNSGFRLVKPREFYKDDDLRVSGSPWRLFVRGSLKIPVFRKHLGELQAGPSQFFTIAAYCHLVEKLEGGESPYGLIVFPRTQQVLAVPATRGRVDFPSAIERFREMLQAVDRGEKPNLPRSSAACSGCVHGNPKRFVPEEPGKWELDASHWGGPNTPIRRPTIHIVGGEVISPHIVFGNDEYRYHSLCGDLFQWIPPHNRAKGLALQEKPHATLPTVEDSGPVVIEAPRTSLPTVNVTVNNTVNLPPGFTPYAGEQPGITTTADGPPGLVQNSNVTNQLPADAPKSLGQAHEDTEKTND